MPSRNIWKYGLGSVTMAAAVFTAGVYYGRWQSLRVPDDGSCTIPLRSKDGIGLYAKIPPHDCEALKPVRLQGVWRYGFEESGFYPGATREPGRSEWSDVWFDIDEMAAALLLKNLGVSGDHTTTVSVAVDFVGYRSVQPGKYGHMGGSRHTVIPTRIISSHLLETSRSRPSPR